MLIDNFFSTGTIAINATTSSGSQVFASQNSILAESIEIYNSGLVPVFVAFGKTGTSTTASVPSSTEVVNGRPIAPGAIMVLKFGIGNDTVAAITASGTATIYATAGGGN